MENLTRTQRNVLNTLKDFQNKKGYSPTIRELGKELGLNSSATIFTHLLNLEKKGYIKRINQRKIEIVKGE